METITWASARPLFKPEAQGWSGCCSAAAQAPAPSPRAQVPPLGEPASSSGARPCPSHLQALPVGVLAFLPGGWCKDHRASSWMEGGTRPSRLRVGAGGSPIHMAQVSSVQSHRPPWSGLGCELEVLALQGPKHLCAWPVTDLGTVGADSRTLRLSPPGGG